MPSLLPEAPQSDPGPHLYLGTRKTHLIPEYVYLSDDHQSLLLGTRLQTSPCKAGRERGPQVSLSEARKNFYLRFCHGLPEQGKYTSGGPIHQESFLKAIFVPCSQEATQYSAGGPLFQAGQQWQVDQWWAQEVSRKQSVPLLRCRRPQAGLLSQEADHSLSQRPWCFSNCWYSGSCFWETLRKIKNNPQNSTQTEGYVELPEDICNSSSCSPLVWWFIKQYYLQNCQLVHNIFHWWLYESGLLCHSAWFFLLFGPWIQLACLTQSTDWLDK